MKRLSSAVCALVFSYACGGGGGSTPTTPTPSPATNHSPTITNVTASPAFGISELTTFTVSASAADSDGDTLTYSWDLAGNARSGQTATITFIGNGQAAMRVTVSDGKGGSASDSRTVTVGSATGTWYCTQMPSTLAGCKFVLQQTGSVVTGSYSDIPYGSGGIDPAQPGRIDVNGQIEMRTKQGRFTDFTFRGQMDQTGHRITGGIFGSGFNGQPFTIEKQ